MNNFSLYTFRLYHYLLTVRDTLEYTIKRDHKIEVYENRKKVLTDNLEEGTPFGDFLKNNGETGEKIKEKIKSFIEDLYSENSTILIPSGETVRVDVAQLVTLFDMTVGIAETLRDIVYQYVNHGLKSQDQEQKVDDLLVQLVSEDERMYRVVLSMLVMRSFEESFAEFQKVMNESKGQPTPQSNFIVQNELVKLAGYLRFSRQHTRCTDNETLDLLDETLKVIEMTEGRRQRPNNRGFKDIFDELNNKLNSFAAQAEGAWKQTYQKAVEEVTAHQQPQPQADQQIN
ncbi:MAG: hypothetical protein J6T25_01425 [Bacilli bacterium]|nr:hypothetical protein [Bacilli bacterium]